MRINKISIFLSILTLVVASLVVFSKTKPLDKEGFNWVAGKNYRFNISYSSEGKGNFIPSVQKNQVPSLDQAFYSELVSVVNFNVVDVSDQITTIEIIVDMKDFIFSYNGDDNVLEKLDRPLYIKVRFDQYGAIIDYKMFSSQYEGYADIARDILSLLELQLSKEEKTEWDGIEKSLIHEIKTHYQVIFSIPFLDKYFIKKTYKKIPSILEVGGSINYWFDQQQGIFTEINGVKTQTYIFDKKVMSENELSIDLTLLDIQDELLEIDYDDDTVVDTMGQDHRKKEMKHRSMARLLGSDNIETLREKFKSVALGNQKDIIDLNRKLVALLTLYPDLSVEVANLLYDYHARDPRLRAIGAALAYVGSEEAQDALIGFLQQLDEGESKHLVLMTNLAFIETPSENNEAYFFDLAETAINEEVRGKSFFALGIIAGNLKESDTQRDDYILSALAERLASADSEDETLLYLKAIGNIGMDKQEVLLMPYLDSTSKAIKEQAIKSLRFIDTKTAKAQLIEYLNSSNKEIREIAARSLSMTPGSQKTLTAYKDRLFEETSIAVLKPMLSNLMKMADEYPEAILLVDEFIEQCVHPDLCGYVKGLRQ